MVSFYSISWIKIFNGLINVTLSPVFCTLANYIWMSPIFDNCYFVCIKTFLIRYNFEQVSKFKFAPLNSPQLFVK